MESVVAGKAPELADVFSLYGAAYRKAHKLPLQHRKVMLAIEACRTAVLGGHVSKCDRCGHTHNFYNSCRNRHCPKCQTLATEKWIEQLSSRLLPVKHFHVVFTIPSELNRLCLINQKSMYDILFHAASQTILSLGRDKRHLGGEMGLIAVLHTWGQSLTDHPHLHTLVPSGGWSNWNGFWKYCKKGFFVDRRVISRLFRGKFLAELKDVWRTGNLKFEGELAPLSEWRNFKTLLDNLYKKDWVVFTQPAFKDAITIVRYLGRYTHRVAISNKRIKGISDGKVTFSWKDYSDKNRQKLMKLDAAEFIRRMLLHVLPAGFRKIRYFGIMSSRARPVLEKCRLALGRKGLQSKLHAKVKWNQALVLLGYKDLLLCPVCQKGNMQVLALLPGMQRAP